MRTTLLSMALLAAASTAFAQDAEMKTGVVATDPTWGSTDIPLKFSAQYSCSQTLYTGAEMDAATGSLDTYTVKQLYFPFYGSLSTDIPMDLKVYMTKTSETTLGAAMSMEDFTLVFSGDLMVTPADPGVTVDLTTPFVMKQGEGVVIALNCDQPEWSLIKFENADINNRVWYAFSADAPCDFTGMSKGSGLPGLTIGYYEGEWSGEVIPETVDLKAVSISGPAKVGLGSLVSVSVTVENLETFTVKVSDDTAVDSVAGDAAFSFADGMLLIGEGVTGVSVADMSGRVILSRDVKAGESVQLNAASGVYVVTLYTADGVKVCKLKM